MISLLAVGVGAVVLFYFFSPWVAAPGTLLVITANAAIRFKRRTVGGLRDTHLGPGPQPRTPAFLICIATILAGYFFPLGGVVIGDDTWLRIPVIVIGALSLWYHSPAVGLSRVGGGTVAALSILIPVLGMLLGYTPFPSW